MKLKILFIVLLNFLFSLYESKILQKSLEFNKILQNPFQFVTKFSYQIGSGAYKMRAKFSQQFLDQEKLNFNGGEYYLHYGVFIDSKWNQIQKDKKKSCNDRMDLANIVQSFDIPMNGSFSQWYEGNCTQHVRAYMWYWAIVDCNEQYKNLGSEIHQMKSIDFEFVFMNSNQSHLSEDLEGFFYPNLVCIIVMITYFIYNYKTIVFKYHQENYNDHYLVINLSLFFELLACLLYQIYIFQCEYGEGNFYLDVSYFILTLLSQQFMMSILIQISTGLTLHFNDLQDHNEYLNYGLIYAALFNIIFGIVGKFSIDPETKLHHYDDWNGVNIIITRMMFFWFFIKYLKVTYQKSKQNVKNFLTLFGLLGVFYILYLPILLIVSFFVADLWKHWVVVMTNTIINVSMLLVFIQLFGSKESDYHKISFKNVSQLDSFYK